MNNYPATATALTPLETTLLERAEDKITTAITTAIANSMDAAEALHVIRDQRLYRAKYSTFEDYCQLRWHFSRQRASQLIQASESLKAITSSPPHALELFRERSTGIETLSTRVDKTITPTSSSTSGNHNAHSVELVADPAPAKPLEKVLRPLSALPAADKPKAWERAREIARAKEEPLKADHVQQAVHETKGLAGGNWNLGQGLPNSVIAKPKESNWERVAAKERSINAANDSEESTPLGELKRYWVRATKKDRKAFLKWAKV